MHLHFSKYVRRATGPISEVSETISSEDSSCGLVDSMAVAASGDLEG